MNAIHFLPLCAPLTLNGLPIDGTVENARAVGLYTLGPLIKSKPNPPAVWKITRMFIHIVGNGVASAGGYGTITQPLTNGIRIYVEENGEILSYLDGGMPILSNQHWERLCYDVGNSNFGQGNNSVKGRWSFEKDNDESLRLHAASQQKLVVQVQDDLSALTGHFFMIKYKILTL